ncbi:MAG: hypothetical protein WCQ95_12810 [Bacteroidota bacterium]
MKNEIKKDCGCDDGCCQPKKSKLWAKILFAVVIVAAIAIIAIKFTGNNNNSDNKSTMVKNEKIGATDSTKSCCPKSNASCCPKGKK